MSHKAFNKRWSNNSGFFRVSKIKAKTRKGYRFKYAIYNEYLKVSLAKINLLDLKDMIVENNLH